ncbi:hypothetical protein Ancab_026019 [Ancistrocladus abbreviatus]
MEVALPKLELQTTIPSPYITAPSSPKLFDDFSDGSLFSGGELGESRSSIPFKWEEKPGKPKLLLSDTCSTIIDDQEDELSISFAFAVDDHDHHQYSPGICGSLSLSAEELFDDGKIKPLKPPPRLQQQQHSTELSHDSLRHVSPITLSKRIFTRDGWSRRSYDFDPFEAAIVNARKHIKEEVVVGGGKSRTTTSFRKWRLKSLSSLFRSSSSEGSTGGVNSEQDSKNSSFRSTGSFGSVSSSVSSAAHEARSMMNRPGLERKSSSNSTLVYRGKLLGCLGINRPVRGLVKGS